ncbi:MAG TPA: carbohydrate kinase [Bacteroides sp.]|nr:carbohydrate kinase [Bacteroides sp.]
MRRVFGFGETVLDIIFKNGQPVAAKPGGSVLNTFVSLGRLGWNPFFISEYANDDVGKIIDNFLTGNGVNTRYVSRFSDGKSALALAFLDSENNANYTFYKDFPKKRLQDLPADLSSEDIILFGSIYASSKEVRASVFRFLKMGKEKGCLIIYDPNFRKSHLSELEELKPRIIENIEYADIVRGSDEDFKLIFGLEDLSQVSDQVNTERKVLLYTRNTRGVQVRFRSSSVNVPGEIITPVSTIGAGDNFNAGILLYLLQNGLHRKDLESIGDKDLQALAETGVKLASHVCMHYDNYISREFARTLGRK